MVMGGVSACRWVMLVQATLLDLFGLDRDLGPPEELAENECALVEVRKASLLLQHGGSCKSHHLFHLWFRLFVLHVYHAGASNVRAVVSKIAPQIGNRELIMEMWQTKAASFGNNSQNYTQLALASQFILDELVYATCTEINRLK